jgi:hypothetical protein
MRYFKFDGAWPDIQLLKDQSASLATLQQKQYRREKRLGRIGCVVSSLISIGTFIGFLRLIQLLAPSEASTLVIILYGLLGLLGIGVSLFVAPLIGALAAIPFWRSNRNEETRVRQQFMRLACQHLRKYYELQEPFLVTKCYTSSDRKFDRHDVCLFIADGKLRITANLHYGFFDPKRDLGCYELTRQEIRLQDTEHKDRPAVQLQAEDLSFTLGCRAKAFIENDFLGRTP